MYGSGSTHLQIYKNIYAKLTKSLNPNQKKRSMKKIQGRFPLSQTSYLQFNCHGMLMCHSNVVLDTIGINSAE